MLSLLTNSMGNGVQSQRSFSAPRCQQWSVPVEWCQCDPWLSLMMVFFLSPQKNLLHWALLFQGKDSSRSISRSDKPCHCKPSLILLFPSADHPSFHALGSFIVGSGLLYTHRVPWGSCGEQDLPAAPGIYQGFTSPYPTRSDSSCGGKNGRRFHFLGCIYQYLWKSSFGECTWPKKKKNNHLILGKGNKILLYHRLQ